MSTIRPLGVFGSVNVDIVCYCETLPRPGQTIHADRSATGLGGKGANQAAAIARLGVPVQLAGRTGIDAFADLARRRLGEFGVGMDHLRFDAQQPTGIALINIDRQGENVITVAGGANLAVDETDVQELMPTLRRSAALLLQLEIPKTAVLAAARAGRAAGARVILDPAPAPAEGLAAEFFQAADVMTPNETETELLVGIRPQNEADAKAAAARFKELGLAAVVVKMGRRGVYFSDGDGAGFVPPFPVRAIDSVAAGDCFNGGLAVALAAGQSLAAAVRFAAACGALATTRQGASDAAPSRDEVEKLLAG